MDAKESMCSFRVIAVRQLVHLRQEDLEKSLLIS